MARWPIRRLKVGHLMLAVAVVAVGCLLLRSAWHLVDEAIYGPYGLGIASRVLKPGQSVVLYRGDECLGGAVIDATDARLGALATDGSRAA